MRRKHVLEKRLRRSAAAALLGLSPATLRRYELQGILPAVKLNSRITLYREDDVLKLASGEVEAGSTKATATQTAPRNATGNFAARG
jgi:hypothetical protein